MSVLLGIDNPDLVEMLQVDGKEKVAGAFAVTTRAAEKKGRAEEAERQRREKASGVQPTPLGDELPTWMSEIDEEVYGKSKEKERKTRKEKRDERKRQGQLEVNLEVIGNDSSGEESETEAEKGVDGEGVRHALDVSAEELKGWQASDESLMDVREAWVLQSGWVAVSPLDSSRSSQ